MQELSKTHIKDKCKRKTNPILAETLYAARKQKNWLVLAHKLSGSTRLHSSINLDQIDAKTSAGDTVIVPGKVLGSGQLTKKVRICSLNISSSARQKMQKTRSEYVSILDEIKKNPKAEGIKIL